MGGEGGVEGGSEGVKGREGKGRLVRVDKESGRKGSKKGE